MVDAYGKFPSGILRGNIIEQGDFDECLSIRDSGLFNPQYCLGMISKPEFGPTPFYQLRQESMIRAVQDIPAVALNTRMAPGDTGM